MNRLSTRGLVTTRQSRPGNVARRAYTLGLAAVVGAAVLLAAGAGATSAVAGSTFEASLPTGPLIEFWNGSSWTPQAALNPGGQSNLTAVTAVSARDVWAVGTSDSGYPNGGGGFALAEHWDGSSWQQVAMPTPSGANEVHLNGAAATSATDVWAVGSWAGGRSDKWGGDYSTLIEHWNGGSWTILPSPPSRGTAQLYGVSALSPTNAWAVGYHGRHVGLNSTYVLHWNGKTWKHVASPNPSCHTYSTLDAVAAASPRSVWAVGEYCRVTPGRRYGSNQPLILHWNGKTWKHVQSPTPRASGWLDAVAVAGRNDVWAVGGYHNGYGDRPLAEQWNGHSWRLVPARVGTPAQGLTSLAVVTGNDIWAVGTYDSGDDRTLSEHWDGTAWSLVPSPNPGGPPRWANHFSAIAAATATAVWAVGSYYPGD